MPRNVYAEINLHIVWHTKGSLPLLNPAVEARAHHHIKHYVLQTEGCLFHEVGGTENHIHLAVSVPPTLLISEWIGKIKGACSYYTNKEAPNRNKALEWQTGYGVISFGSKDLPWVINYIRNQKEHHAKRTTYERLERLEREEG
jgi:putative transposase